MTTNWVFDKEPKDFANKALRKAGELECSRLRDGWRWTKVRHNLSILVPCDKRGKPTKQGAEMIAKYNEMF